MGYAYDGEWVVSTILDDRAERFGDRVFVESLDEDVTFGELRDRAQRVAAALGGLGVKPGDRVASMLPAKTTYLGVWFGIVWAGAVDVPINNEYKGEFLRHIVADSGAEVLVIQDRWVERLEGLELPQLKHVVVVGEAEAELPKPYVAHTLAEALSHDPAPKVSRREDELVYIMYTSGTTGPSKGVMHVNRSALWNAYAWLDIVSLDHTDVAYSMFPLFHVTARSAVVSSSMWAGSKVVMRDRFSASEYWDDIREVGATWFGYMGAVIHLLWKQPPRPDDADNPVTRAFGAAAPPEVVEAFEERFGLFLIEVYGGTECGPVSAPTPRRRKVGAQGVILPHVLVEIHDEHDRPVPPGVEGEIVHRPAVPYGIFQGYWNLPDRTVEAFQNLWWHSGDGGKMDEDGFLTFTDRIKDSIRRRGENISSFEVERTVQSHPAVLEAGAYAVPSDLTEEEVMVSVILGEGAELDVRDLWAHLIEEMPRFAVPRYIRFVDELPKTPSQRIQKYRLREIGVTDDTFDREALGIAVPR
ncbi:MAG TPA: AMP-binding protein [Acidimicrobiia bacterium]|nr:AMP-binding protein [Acidimicrobiia bacterium]